MSDFEIPICQACQKDVRPMLIYGSVIVNTFCGGEKSYCCIECFLKEYEMKKKKMK